MVALATVDALDAILPRGADAFLHIFFRRRSLVFFIGKWAAEKKENGGKKMGGDETIECDMCSMEVRVASCALRVVRGDVLCAACAACDLSRTMRATLHI